MKTSKKLPTRVNPTVVGRSRALRVSQPKAKTPKTVAASKPAAPVAVAVAPIEPPAFDLDNPSLPNWLADAALPSGGFSHAKKLERKIYEAALKALQIELRKLQNHLEITKGRLIVVFEGRDAAGKGSAIKRVMQHLNPRTARTVALSKPTEAERGQWYFQRYVAHLPAGGNIVLFDRSWYNRAGVERVMGFASPDQVADFLREAPQFEGLLVRDDVHLIKFYLEIGREMQLKRFHRRRHDPLKVWKITDIDRAAMGKWDAYTQAKAEMFRFTHTPTSPWTVIKANDKRRTRLEVIRAIVSGIEYPGKDLAAIGSADRDIVGSGSKFFDGE